MSNVDWGQAPEGATHKVPTGCWYKVDDHQVYCWCHAHWGGPYSVRQYEDGSFEQMVARPSTQWNGTDLPPVGTAVDCKCTAKTKARDWFPAEVKYVSPYTVVLTDYSNEELDGEFVAHPATLIFRHRKTPEQVAAEEREAAIKEMYETSYAGDIWHILGSLYDAGYRRTKQEVE